MGAGQGKQTSFPLLAPRLLRCLTCFALDDTLFPQAEHQLHDGLAQAAKAAHLEGPSGPRNRKRVNYNEVAAAKSSSPDENSPEREQRTSSGNNAWSPSDSDVDDLEDGAEGLGQKRRPRQIVGKSWTKAEVKCLVDTLAGLGEGRTKQVSAERSAGRNGGWKTEDS